MKRIVLFVSVFLLGACGNNKNTLEDSSSTTSQSSTAISTTTTSQTSTTVTESTSQTTSKSAQTTATSQQESETADQAAYPYAVDLHALGLVDEKGNQAESLANELAFYVTGMNTPLRIGIGNDEANDSQLELHIYGNERETAPRLQVSYHFIVENIPTKEITIFGGPGSDEYRRTVKVNTQLTLKAPVSIQDSGSLATLEGETFYLFYNNQDSLSLATINFAGNVGPEDVDTMQEYVEE